MGTPQIAVPSLELLHAQHEIALVVTQPDKPAGRGHKMQPSPVKVRAVELGLPVAQPERARDAGFLDELARLKPEAMAVVAYGQILPQTMLDLPAQNFEGGGCINLHFSLLPRWRGAAPVQHAILNGDTETGISTQWMAQKLDSGDLILQERVMIDAHETSGELLQRLAEPGARVLSDTLQMVAQKTALRLPQDESNVTLASIFKKEDGKMDWRLSAPDLNNRVRAFNPWPGAWCVVNGETLRIWRADVEHHDTHDSVPGTLLFEGKTPVGVACGSGVLRPIEVQGAGKARMNWLSWANGARLTPGQLM